MTCGSRPRSKFTESVTARVRIVADYHAHIHERTHLTRIVRTQPDERELTMDAAHRADGVAGA